MAAFTEGNLLKGRYEIFKVLSEDLGQALYFAKDRLKNNASVLISEMDLKNKSGKVFTPEALSNLVDILGSLSYKTIPKLIQVFSVDNTYYIITEYVEGSFLEEVLQKKGEVFTFEEAYNWMVELAETIHYLHGLDKPVIVRGISPAAIKITNFGDLKLVDFNMARFYTQNKDFDTLFVWNPGYTSPEQYGSQRSDVRSDIYSYGATFYRLFTMQEVGLMNFTFPPVSYFNRSFTPEQDRFIAKCLARDINERFQSAYSVKQALIELSLKKIEEPVVKTEKPGFLRYVKSIFGRK